MPAAGDELAERRARRSFAIEVEGLRIEGCGEVDDVSFGNRDRGGFKFIPDLPILKVF